MKAQCENLKAYLDGESGLSERLMMRVHLRSCAACREDAREFRTIGKAVRRIEGTPIPETLKDRIVADAVAHARPLPSPSRMPRIQGVSTMRKAVFAAVMVVAIGMIGLGVIPRGRGNTALADVIRAMSRVKTVHFVGWTMDASGNRSKVEGWVEGSSRYRMRTETGGRAYETADDGRVHVEVGAYDGSPQATISRSADARRHQPRLYVDMFNGKERLASILDQSRPTVKSHQTSLPNGRKAVVYELEWPRQKTTLQVDPETDLIIGLENRKLDGEISEKIERIDYDMEIPDSAFVPETPRGARVIDMITPEPPQVTEGRRIAVERLLADPSADVGIQGIPGGGSAGASYHSGFLFENVGSGELTIGYLTNRNVYRVIGKARVFREDGSYSRFVEDQDVRLPGKPVKPQIPQTVLIRDGKPGEFCHAASYGYGDDFERFVNVGSGPLTIVERDRRNGEFIVIKGRAELVPFGIIYENQTVDRWALPDVRNIRDPRKLDWSHLPASEVRSAKAVLDIALRVHRLSASADADGYVTIDGERVKLRGQYDGGYHSGKLSIMPAVKDDPICVMGLESRREYLIFGRAKVLPSGRICKNGRVSFDGEVLSSEE